MQRTVYAVLALAVVLSGCVGVPGPETTEEFNRTVTVAPESGIVVINRDGNVDVSVREGGTVAVHAVKRSIYGQGELDRVRIEVTEGDPLRIETVHDGVNPRASVDYTIEVPATVLLQRVESSNGGIDLAGVRVNGTDLRTSNGPIRVGGAPGGDITAATSNGPIEVRGLAGYVTAMTSNGGITVEDSGGVLGLQTSNGPILADIPAVRGDTVITTSNGRITLWFAGDLDIRVVATTSNGRVTADDLPLLLDESSGTRIAGTLGSGGPTIAVTTSNGNIGLEELRSP